MAFILPSVKRESDSIWEYDEDIPLSTLKAPTSSQKSSPATVSAPSTTPVASGQKRSRDKLSETKRAVSLVNTIDDDESFQPTQVSKPNSFTRLLDETDAPSSEMKSTDRVESISALADAGIVDALTDSLFYDSTAVTSILKREAGISISSLGGAAPSSATASSTADKQLHVMMELMKLRSDVVKAIDGSTLAWDSSKFRPPGINHKPVTLPSRDIAMKTSAKAFRNLFAPLLINGSLILYTAAVKALLQKALTAFGLYFAESKRVSPVEIAKRSQSEKRAAYAAFCALPDDTQQDYLKRAKAHVVQVAKNIMEYNEPLTITLPAPAHPDAVFAHALLLQHGVLPADFSADTNCLKVTLSAADKAAMKKQKAKAKGNTKRPAKKSRKDDGDRAGDAVDYEEFGGDDDALGDEVPTLASMLSQPALLRAVGEVCDLRRVLPGLAIRSVIGKTASISTKTALIAELLKGVTLSWQPTSTAGLGIVSAEAHYTARTVRDARLQAEAAALKKGNRKAHH